MFTVPITGAPKVSSEELAKLCESFAGKPKRAMCKKYRRMLPSGKLSTSRFEADTRYADGAYRADKKRVGNAPRGLWLGNVADVTTAATRDY